MNRKKKKSNKKKTEYKPNNLIVDPWDSAS